MGKDYLNAMLGAEVEIFAYPFGGKNHYNEMTLKSLRKILTLLFQTLKDWFIKIQKFMNYQDFWLEIGKLIDSFKKSKVFLINNLFSLKNDNYFLYT